MVEFKFYDTFPAASKKIVLRAMEYISSKVSCITFREATEMTADYILIWDGVNLLVLINSVGPHKSRLSALYTSRRPGHQGLVWIEMQLENVDKYM